MKVAALSLAMATYPPLLIYLATGTWLAALLALFLKVRLLENKA